ncbi:MAG: hypothetical protein IK109_09435 [Clostridiales bacterium]|nr:hypothetical protein [Clostridiales bacterium]
MNDYDEIYEMVTDPRGWFTGRLRLWCWTFATVSVLLVFIFVCFFIHDVVETKKAGFILDAETELSELSNGKSVQIDEYTVLFEYKRVTASESGKTKNCAIGLIDKESKEIRYILAADVDYSTIDIANISKTETIPETDMVLYTVPIKGELAMASGVDALPQEMKDGLKDKGWSDDQIASKCLLYSLNNVEEGHRVVKFVKPVILPYEIGAVFAFALAAVICRFVQVKLGGKEESA